MENKPRKRQLSEEQPSGNGVKKPKVSVWDSQDLVGKWLPWTCGQQLPARARAESGVLSTAAGHGAGPGCRLWTGCLLVSFSSDRNTYDTHKPVGAQFTQHPRNPNTKDLGCIY